jgi:hypothetical protein
VTLPLGFLYPHQLVGVDSLGLKGGTHQLVGVVEGANALGLEGAHQELVGLEGANAVGLEGAHQLVGLEGANALGLEGANALGGVEGANTLGLEGAPHSVVGLEEYGAAKTLGLEGDPHQMVGFEGANAPGLLDGETTGATVGLEVENFVVGCDVAFTPVGLGGEEGTVVPLVLGFVVTITVGDAFIDGLEVVAAGAGVAMPPPQLAGGFADKIQIC